MKVFSWDDILNSHVENSPCYRYFTGSALTIGGFDGPHIGHKILCDRVLECSKKNSIQSGVITFAHSPRLLKDKKNYPGDVSTLRLKLKTFEKWGFDFVVVIDFSKNFSKIEGATFLRILTDRCVMQFLTVGEGFRCGYKGETDTAHIESFAKDNKITFVLAPLIHIAMHTISSSAVRQCVVAGKLDKCKDLLGFSYMLDIQDTDYVVNTSSNACIVIERKNILQVLPPNGEYTVNLFLQKNNISFSTILILDNTNLRLSVPIKYENKQFDVITFDEVG